MSYSVPTIDNYVAWNDTEQITLTSPNKSGDTTYTIATAKRRAPTYKEQLPTGGVYGSALLTWILPAKLVTAAGATGNDEPRQAFRITDSTGKVWTVQDAALNTLKSTWRCVSLNLSIAHNLRDTLNVRRAALTKDAASGRTYTAFTTPYSAIACRFQEQDAGEERERGKLLTVRRYIVPVEQRLFITVEDQVIDQDGNVYEVKGWKDADRIDQLQQLTLERDMG